jgi:AcrR family transcriptional regulator
VRGPGTSDAHGTDAGAGETGATGAPGGVGGGRPPVGGPGQTVSAPRSAGRPRSAAADLSILEAATAILAERGLSGMSMEEVAARAGVGKATVYRRWPSRGALALDAFMAEFRSQLALPDTGTLRGDLLAALRSWSRAVTTSRAGRMLAGLIAEAQRDPQLASAWRERVFDPLRAQHKALVERAVRRGEIRPGTDADVVLDLVFGAAYHRLLQGHLPLNDRFARQVVDLVMDGLAPGQSKADS